MARSNLQPPLKQKVKYHLPKTGELFYVKQGSDYKNRILQLVTNYFYDPGKSKCWFD